MFRCAAPLYDYFFQPTLSEGKKWFAFSKMDESMTKLILNQVK